MKFRTSKRSNCIEEEFPEPGKIESVVLIAAAGFSCFLNGATYSDGILVAEWMDYFQRGSGITAWLGSVGNGLAYCLAPIAGICARKYGTRKIYVISGLLGSICISVTAFSPDFYAALIFKIMTGFIYAFNVTPLAPYLISRFKRRAPFANGCAMLGVGLGGITYPLIINKSLQIYGWRGCCLLIGGISFHHIPIGLLLKSWKKPINANKLLEADVAGFETEEESIKQRSSETTPCEDIPFEDKSRRKSSIRSLAQLEVFKKGLFIRILVHTLFLYMGVSIIYVLLVDSFRNMLGLSIEEARINMSVLAVTNLCGRFVVSFLVQHPKIDTLTLQIVLNVLLGVIVGCLPFCYGNISAMMSSAAMGLCLAGYGSLGQLIVAELIGEKYIFMSYGYLLCAGGIGYVLGGPIAGWIRDGFDNYDYSFYFGGSVFVASTVVMLPDWIKHLKLFYRREPKPKLSKETREWIASNLSLA